MSKPPVAITTAPEQAPHASNDFIAQQTAAVTPPENELETRLTTKIDLYAAQMENSRLKIENAKLIGFEFEATQLRSQLAERDYQIKLLTQTQQNLDAQNKATEEKLSAQEKRLKELTANNQDLAIALEGAKTQAEALEKNLQQADLQVRDLDWRLQNTRTEAVSATARAEEYQQQLSQIEQRWHEAQAQADLQAAAAIKAQTELSAALENLESTHAQIRDLDWRLQNTRTDAATATARAEEYQQQLGQIEQRWQAAQAQADLQAATATKAQTEYAALTQSLEQAHQNIYELEWRLQNARTEVAELNVRLAERKAQQLRDKSVTDGLTDLQQSLANNELVVGDVAQNLSSALNFIQQHATDQSAHIAEQKKLRAQIQEILWQNNASHIEQNWLEHRLHYWQEQHDKMQQHIDRLMDELAKRPATNEKDNLLQQLRHQGLTLQAALAENECLSNNIYNLRQQQDELQRLHQQLLAQQTEESLEQRHLGLKSLALEAENDILRNRLHITQTSATFTSMPAYAHTHLSKWQRLKLWADTVPAIRVWAKPLYRAIRKRT